jgi:hypothetical protein
LKKRVTPIAILFITALLLSSCRTPSPAPSSSSVAAGSASSTATSSSAASSKSSQAASSKASASSGAAAGTASKKPSGGGAAVTAVQWPAGGSVPSRVYLPNLDGQNVESNSRATADLSYTSWGFVKIHLNHPSSKRIKVIVSKSGEYRYDLPSDGGSAVYPLQMGSGTYTFSVYENISGNEYSQVFSTQAAVSLRSSQIPFLVPNQMVDYSFASNAAVTAQRLVAGKTNNYERISAVLSYVASHISYDYAFAKTVKSGYVPDVDSVLASGRGICFDYASVAAAMLRSLGYPTRLVMGYIASGTYHAWNEVYIEGQGWIKVMAVKINSDDWSRVDVTFISTATSPAKIESYIGDASNYRKIYVY